MSKFIRKPIGTVASIRRGASPRPIDDWMSPTGIPWVKISDATRTDSRFIKKTEGYIHEDGKNKSVEVFPEDLIISNSATPGLPRIMKIHACIHDGWLLAEDFKGVTRDYLFYQIKYLRKYLVTQGNGSIFTNLKTDILKEFPIVIPVDQNGRLDIDKQKKLANVLIKIEDKIENNNKINEELESIAKTLYDYWFLQFEFPNEEGKPYKSSGGKMVWNEELKREIPDGWKATKVDDIIKPAPKIKSIKAPDYLQNGMYPIVDQAEGLITGYTNSSDLVYENKDGCVVFGDVTTYFKFINFPFAKGTDGTKIMESKDNRIPSLLLYYLLKDAQLPNIGFARHYMYLRDYKFVLPPKYVCKMYDDVTKEMMFLRKNIIVENQELASLRDFLLPLLMNGQVEFKEEQ